jgi:hypothetical protein
VKPSIPSPAKHPNGYATLSAGSVAAFLIFEAHDRLGIDFNTAELAMIPALVAAVFIFVGKKLKG